MEQFEPSGGLEHAPGQRTCGPVARLARNLALMLAGLALPLAGCTGLIPGLPG